MGVLDDAIREHLELRRRHGVAEEELEKQAEEALGPARREVAPEEEDGHAEAPHAEPDADGEPPLQEADHEPAPEPAAHAESLGAPTEEHAVEELEFDDEPDEPELSETLPAEAARSDIHDETLDPNEAPERDLDELDEEEELDDDELLEDEDDEDPPADDSDVLEDTPDFLQETPEHDRLWFEQKPPRDFDFD